MPQQQSATARKGLCPLPAAIALALTTLAAGAMAQSSPYYIGVKQAFTHDDNVYRRATDGPLPVVADTVSSTGIVAGIDQPFGRQHFYANGNVTANRNKNQDQLNNTSYGVAAGLDWSTIERLSGNFSLAANQALANYGDANATATTDKNLQKSQQFNANVRYGLAASLGLEGGINHSAVDFSLPDDLRTVRNDGANLGLRWGGGGALSLGLTGRVSKAKYPTILQSSPGVFESDKLDRHDVETSVTWIPTGASTISGHLSFTRENHTLASQPNFSGVTGGVQWDYHLTGKLGLTAALNRDTGTASTFLQLSQVPTAVPTIPILPTPTETIRVDSNRLSNTAILTVNYELTAKIRLDGNLRHTSSSSSGAGSETMATYAFGVKYDPTRTITLGCNASRETRAGFYSANVVGCDAQITFR